MLNENNITLSRVDAMDRCISLGKNFIEHFDKIYNNSNEQSVNHWINEMTNWYEEVKQITLENTNKPILKGELRDWFFTAGANPENFMNHATNDELEKYDIFSDKVLNGTNIKSALRLVGIINSINNTIKNLKKSPIFPMSKGAMELFHSNFWKWLIEEIDYEYATAFIEDKNFNFNQINKVEREKKHTDLLISVGNKSIVIENKIKTLPTKEQLKTYEESFKKRFYGGVCVIPCEYDNNLKFDKWTLITYDKILSNLTEITNKNKSKICDEKGQFCYDLINEYINTTRCVEEIISSKISEFDKKIIKSVDVKDINELGLADIVKKINGYMLLKYLKEQLVEKYPEDKYHYILSFNHKSITISIRKIIRDNEGYILLGPQLEEISFRRMIHITNNYFKIRKNRTDRDLLYKNLKNIYYDNNEDNSNFVYPKINKDNKLYNEYNGTFKDEKYNLSNEEYIAIYRNFKVEQTSFEYILKLFKDELEYVSEKVEEKEIIKHLKEAKKSE